ncbi:hypothetical protein PMN64_24595 [Bradyrhizobium sp. UFLA01-814]|uniref:hypothetical protein n=1 Tax=Bradyrhizobium sp. UFLA01-814 TaxID=3023480 RepID=UPI00398B642F
MADFLSDIRALDAKHNRGQTLNQDQLAVQIFRQSPTFKDERAVIPYLRYQLRVALEELTILDREMRDLNNGSISYAVLSRFGRILIDYLFDLREILIVLKRKEPGWKFFNGEKNSGATSWEIFGLARGLAFQSTYVESGPPFDHKIAQIASIFVLRQAMELRFERLIAVYPTDRNGKPPKLRHGFHQEFIAANPSFFLADGFRVKELRHLYDWSSEIVHQAYQPYAWQISMALRRGGDLLRSRSAPGNRAWSIFNSIAISDVEAMQTAYERHFLATYGHGTWLFTRAKPEALVPNWTPNMAFTSTDFRPALNRPGLCSRIRSRFRRLWDGW